MGIGREGRKKKRKRNQEDFTPSKIATKGDPANNRKKKKGGEKKEGERREAPIRPKPSPLTLLIAAQSLGRPTSSSRDLF